MAYQLRTSGVFNLGSLGGDTVAGGDADFDSVVLLLDGESSTIADVSSNTGSNVVVGTDVSQSTTVVKHGTGSIEFGSSNSQNNYITTTIPALSSDYTIEFFIYPNSVTTEIQVILDRRTTSATSNPLLVINTLGQIEYSQSGSKITSSAISATAWTHLAVVRSGTTVTLYVNGSSAGTINEGTTVSWASNTSYIGRRYAIASNKYYGTDGYIDDFRITKGVARYSSSFTPPTSALPTTGTVVGATRPTRKWGGLVGRSLVASTAGFAIDYSLDFDGSGDYLVDTLGTTGNRQTFTYSCWVKRSAQNRYDYLFTSTTGTTTEATLRIGVDASTDNLLGFFQWSQSSSFAWKVKTTSTITDTEWHHVVLSVDTRQQTQADRVKIYLDGSLTTHDSASTYMAQNANINVNLSNNDHGVGGDDYWGSINGQLAEVHFIDGQALAASDFGETVSGTWYPKAYSGTYGTNGFHLDFADNSTTAALGTDVSGQGNNFTVTGLSTTDQLTDAPAAAPSTFSLAKTGALKLSELLQATYPAPGAESITYWLATAYEGGATTDGVLPTEVEVDSTGNMYVLSSMDSTTYGTDGRDFVLTKLNAAGEFQWHKLLAGAAGGSEAASVNNGGGLAVDGDDNLIIGQTAQDRNGATTNTGFVAKISPAGSIIWQRIQDAGGTDQSRAYACIADKSTNDIYVAGQAYISSYDAYVVKYNSSGTEQWQKFFRNSSGTEAVYGIKLDTNGDVLVSGFDTSGATRGMVAKLSKSTGAISWSRYVGNTTNNKNFNDMAIDGDDPVMVGWNQQNSSGSNDLWLAKYNNSGTYQWGRLLGGSGNDQGYAIATDDSGNVYVGGFQSSDVAHTSVTQTAILAKYDSSGTIQWQKRFTADNNSGNLNRIVGIRIHPDGSLILAINSYNGAGSDYSIQVMKLPADDTLWPSTVGDWSIATSSLTDKSAATTQGSVTYTTSTSGITSSAGAMTISDPSASFTEVRDDISA